MRIEEGSKQCSQCGLMKSNTDYFLVKRLGESAREAACKACRVERQRRQRSADPAKFRAYQQQWNAANRERKAQRAREWRAANRERWNAYLRERRAANLEEYRARGRQQASARRAMERGAMADPHVTVAWLRARDGDSCYYCGTLMDFSSGTRGRRPPVSAELEHKIPLVRGGQHSEANCVLACRHCNARKSSKTAEEFLASSNL